MAISVGSKGMSEKGVCGQIYIGLFSRSMGIHNLF